MQAPKPEIKPQPLSRSELYNILQTSGFLIIDCRKTTDFHDNHIKTALTIDTITCKAQCDQGILNSPAIEKSFQRPADKSRWASRSYSHVIVYNSSGNGSAEDVNIIVTLIISERKTPRLSILDGGFGLFCAAYPFLCVPSPKLNADGIPETVPESVTKANLVYPSEIVEGFLFLGGNASASSVEVLQNLNITRIVNMTSELVNAFEKDKEHHMQYMHRGVDDVAHADIKKHFEEIIEWMEKAREHHHRVLVHCAMGVSRSSTIVLAYLIKIQKMTLKDAFEYVRQRRPFINPNWGFLLQLVELEVSVHGKATLKLDDQHNRIWM